MNIEKFIEENSSKGQFVPYTYWDSCLKKLSVYLKDEEHVVEFANEEIEVFKSLTTDEIVGCRLNLSGKFIQVQQDDFK